MDEAPANRLRDQMANVRRDLDGAVEVLANRVKDLADWRYYVRRFPWACVGAAGALGFLIIPRRTKPAEPKGPFSQPLNVADASVGGGSMRRALGGMATNATSYMANALLRIAAGYVQDRVMRQLWERSEEAAGEKDCCGSGGGCGCV